eukprot:m.266532 g.266532  ORF g.266532 m.266532 type:complete len:64 (+) comp15631_c0_seq3:1853-2044(+)
MSYHLESYFCFCFFFFLFYFLAATSSQQVNKPLVHRSQHATEDLAEQNTCIQLPDHDLSDNLL